jgi:hypothetical protein
MQLKPSVTAHETESNLINILLWFEICVGLGSRYIAIQKMWEVFKHGLRW